MKNIARALKRFIKTLTQTKAERRHEMVGPSHIWKMQRDFQIQFLKTMNLLPDHYLLDIGCGTLRGGIPLIAYLKDGHYFGVEARAEVLDEGRKELREADLGEKNPTLLHSPDISQLTINQKFDYIWAFSVLIHMNDEILNQALNFVSNHLSEEGEFYANVDIGEKKERSWLEFPAVTRPLEFYRHACAKNSLAVSDLGSLKDHGHPLPNQATLESQRMLRITKKIEKA